MGLVHAAVGTGFLLAGIYAYRCPAHSSTCLNEGGGIAETTIGSLLVSSGAIFLTSGAPMWTIGARDVRRTLCLTAGGLSGTF